MREVAIIVEYADRNNELDVFTETLDVSLHAQEDLAFELSLVKSRYDNALKQRHASNEFFVSKLLSVKLVEK